MTLLYSKIAGHDSLRAIQMSLGVHSNKWYRLGLEDIKRSTLSDAMKNRPYQIYEGLFYKLLEKIWVAMSYYLLLSYIKFQTKYSYSLQVLTRMIASVLMEQRLLIDILSLDERSLQKVRDPVAQLSLF